MSKDVNVTLMEKELMSNGLRISAWAPEKITWKPYTPMTKNSNWRHFWKFTTSSGIGIWAERYDESLEYSVVVRDYADGVVYESEPSSYSEALFRAKQLKNILSTVDKFNNFLREHKGYVRGDD